MTPRMRVLIAREDRRRTENCPLLRAKSARQKPIKTRLDLCRLRFGEAFTSQFRALADDGVAEAALLAYHAAGYR
jgi:hypothetical protein